MKKQQHWLNKIFIATLLTTCSIIPAHAITLQSHTDIRDAIKSFIIKQQVPLKNIHVTLTSLNKQLRLTQCSKSLHINMTHGSKLMGHTNFSVSCSSPKKWKIHVAAHIDGKVHVFIARHPIPRGTVISESDFTFVLRRYSQLNHGYYDSANSLRNIEAKRNIKAGQILTPALVKAQKLVLRGQHITIVANNGRLNFRVKGKALMDGQQGQTIKVANLKTKKLIYARVISNGLVEVNF